MLSYLFFWFDDIDKIIKEGEELCLKNDWISAAECFNRAKELVRNKSGNDFYEYSLSEIFCWKFHKNGSKINQIIADLINRDKEDLKYLVFILVWVLISVEESERYLIELNRKISYSYNDFLAKIIYAYKKKNIVMFTKIYEKYEQNNYISDLQRYILYRIKLKIITE